jgi:hypothetical protein
MFLKQKYFILTLIFATIRPTYAYLYGNIEFSEAEIKTHAEKILPLTQKAAACLKGKFKHHTDFYKKWGISPYYGDKSSFTRFKYAQQKALFRKLGLSIKLIDEMKPTSCIGLTLQCMAEGFKSTDQHDLWDRIKKFVQLNGQSGLSLQIALRKLGWKSLYWNPKTSSNKAWDAREKKKYPVDKEHFRGHHAYSYLSVKKWNKYYILGVDDATSLVNFGTDIPREFKKIPFFVGNAHLGYHIFSGAYGNIIEAHSTRKITDPRTLETSPFNPLASKGGPRGGVYRSGVLVIPPGFAYKNWKPFKTNKVVCRFNGRNYQPYNIKTKRYIGIKGYGSTKLSTCKRIIRSSSNVICNWSGNSSYKGNKGNKGYRLYTLSGKALGRSNYGFGRNLSLCLRASAKATNKICSWDGRGFRRYSIKSNKVYRGRNSKLNYCLKRL